MSFNIDDLDDFTRAYIECALWSSMDESDPETGGEPLDQNYSIEDIATETLAEMIEDCRIFQERQVGPISRIKPGVVQQYLGETKHSRAGHLFWLTRNHHGSGFWDGDYPKQIGERLTKAAEKFGEKDLYVGDDGKIYQQ